MRLRNNVGLKKEHIIASGATPEVADAWFTSVADACLKYGIDSDERIAMFLAQIAHESSSFTHTVENLNYSSAGLRSTFGRYFPTDELAEEFARQPEKIANRVYANRLGNGPEESGEGWKFRGRGLIQVTGKDNVGAFSVHYFSNDSLVNDPSPLQEKELASMSAGWFWNLRGLNQFADKLDIETVTKKINGGETGLNDRKERWITIRHSMGLT